MFQLEIFWQSQGKRLHHGTVYLHRLRNISTKLELHPGYSGDVAWTLFSSPKSEIFCQRLQRQGQK